MDDVVEKLKDIIRYNEASLAGHLHPMNNDHRLVTIGHAMDALNMLKAITPVRLDEEKLADEIRHGDALIARMLAALHAAELYGGSGHEQIAEAITEAAAYLEGKSK